MGTNVVQLRRALVGATVALLVASCSPATPSAEESASDGTLARPVTLTVLIYSGRENPAIELDETSADSLEAVLGEVDFSPGEAPDSTLGFQGFSLVTANGGEYQVSPDGLILRAADGDVSVGEGREAYELLYDLAVPELPDAVSSEIPSP